MNEGRVVLTIVGLVALAMIALPVATIWTMQRPGSDQQGIDGDLSRAFLAADAQASRDGSAAASPVAAIDRLLPKGMAEKQVFERFESSGFTCATDTNAATCFRTHDTTHCQNDWKVRVIFSEDGTIWSDKAESRATCS